MPTKHIPDSTWRKVEKCTVDAVLATKRPVKDSEILNCLILKGISVMSEKDWEECLKSHSQK